MDLEKNHSRSTQLISSESFPKSHWSILAEKIKKNLYHAKKQQELGKNIRFRKLTLLDHILRLDPRTPAQKAMDKYFDVPYIPTKERPKITLASKLKNDFTSMEKPTKQ